MARRTNARSSIALPLRARVVDSTSTTPQSSAIPSAVPSTYPSEDEGHAPEKPFPLMGLPSELRNKIYGIIFASAPPVIDLDPSTFKILHRLQLFALFRTSHQVYLEASHHFFSTHTFRIFPTYPGRYFKTKKPLLARLPTVYRESLTSLELRVGPGWNSPPRGWIVNDGLGLADCRNVRVLKMFVECDPSDAIYSGYRRSEGFYEQFSANLLEGILKEVPSIKVVEFDAYPAVKRTGDMISGLCEVVAKYDKVVAWGPERGWELESDQVWLDAVLMHRDGGKILNKAVAVFG